MNRSLVNDFKNQSPHVKKNIHKSHSALLDELDDLELTIKRCDFEKDFPTLITTTTRIKIIKDLIILFDYFKHNDTLNINQEDRNYLLNIVKRVNKRIKLHLYQLKILVPKEVPNNIEYFGMIIKISLTILLKVNKY
jgi:hypothetical protein